MTDADGAAARFYRSVTAYEVGKHGPPVIEAVDIAAPSHRYFGAHTAIREQTPKAVLELGSGYVGFTRAIAEMGEFDYHVTDIVPPSRPEELPARVQFHVCNLDDPFPFSTAQFDLVIALMIVEHLYDPFHALAEISRVLAPGGRLVMNLPNIAALKCRLDIARGRLPTTSTPDWWERRQWDGGHLHYFTVAAVKRLCALNGISVERMLPVGRGLKIKQLSIPLLCGEITFMCRKD